VLEVRVLRLDHHLADVDLITEAVVSVADGWPGSWLNAAWSVSMAARSGGEATTPERRPAQI
jgi:hypothetical protein